MSPLERSAAKTARWANTKSEIFRSIEWRASISSGRDDYETPAGVFTVLQKEEKHYSRYDDAAMPFMQRITWSGIALHGGPLPGYPASHGCIRLPHKFAQQIFGMTKLVRHRPLPTACM